MLRKSKHKCYEILNVKEKFGRGDEKKKSNGKSTRMEKLKKEILPERL